MNRECVEISQLFKGLHGAVVEQAPMVDAIEQNVEVTEVQVEEGQRQLQKALSYKKTMYPILGGLVGAVCFGPVGLVAGFKAGSAATVCGGICGYAGGKFLKNANTPTNEELSETNLVSETTSKSPMESEAKLWTNFWIVFAPAVKFDLSDIQELLEEINVDEIFKFENLVSCSAIVSWLKTPKWISMVISKHVEKE